MAETATEEVESGEKIEEVAPTSEQEQEVQPQGEEQTSEASEEVEEQPAKPSRAEKRIKGLVHDNKTKEALLSEKDKRIAELEAANAKKTVESLAFPKEEDFETPAEFHKALSDYNISVLETKQAEKEKASQVEAAQKQSAAQWDGFFDRAEKHSSEKQAEIVEAIEDKQIPLSAVMQQALQESDVGPELAVHFHKNHDVAEKIKGMPMLKAVGEINKIASNIVKAMAGKSVSDAPAPANTLKGGEDPLEKDPDKMTPEEWTAWRNSTKKII